MMNMKWLMEALRLRVVYRMKKRNKWKEVERVDEYLGRVFFIRMKEDSFLQYIGPGLRRDVQHPKPFFPFSLLINFVRDYIVQVTDVCHLAADGRFLFFCGLRNITDLG